MTIAEKLTRAKNDYDEVFEAGKKSEYDRFWDTYQQNGERTAYQNAFSGVGWTIETFKPKYSLIVKGTAENMFANSLNGVDLEQHLSELGLTLDTSGVTSTYGFRNFCYNGSPSVLPVIDTRGASHISNLLYFTDNLVTVRKVILKDDGSQTFTSAFIYNYALENISFEGTFGNDVSFEGCSRLTEESIRDIVNHLSTTASGKSVTFSEAAVNAAFGATSMNIHWLSLIGSRSNWTVALI